MVIPTNLMFVYILYINKHEISEFRNAVCDVDTDPKIDNQLHLPVHKKVVVEWWNLVINHHNRYHHHSVHCKTHISR